MSPFSAPHNQPANTANLRRLFWLRNVAIGGQAMAVAIVTGMAHLYALGFEHLELEVLGIPLVVGLVQSPLPMVAIGIVIVSLAVINALTWLRLRRAERVSQGELFVHLVIDVTAMTALLYLSGGATNPFALLLVLPVIIAATVLPGRFAWTIAAVTVLCYTLLLTKFVPLPHSHAIGHDFSLDVLGGWIGYVLIAALVAYFVVSMGNTLRRQDQLLAQAREHAMRNEQLLALGTLAASTAHELGTPLGTLSLLLTELEQDGSVDRALFTRNLPPCGRRSSGASRPCRYCQSRPEASISPLGA